ncbi:MAG: TonB-dependent receptor [Gemmatimonadales bacterium]
MGTRAAFAIGVGFALAGLPVAAQQEKHAARLFGVVQSTGGDPIEGARVEIRGLGRAGITQSDGRYALDSIRPGRYWVTVQRTGFGPARRAITLDGGDDRALDFSLDPLQAMVSEARAREEDRLYREFSERMESSLEAYFLTRDDIARSRQPLLGAVLAHYLIPTGPRTAVRYRDPGTGFTRSGCGPWESWVGGNARRVLYDPAPEPFVSINGARPLQSRALYEIPPQDVEALEVYRGAESYFNVVPTETQCGVVVIWTR